VLFFSISTATNKTFGKRKKSRKNLFVITQRRSKVVHRMGSSNEGGVLPALFVVKKKKKKKNEVAERKHGKKKGTGGIFGRWKKDGCRSCKPRIRLCSKLGRKGGGGPRIILSPLGKRVKSNIRGKAVDGIARMPVGKETFSTQRR